MKGRKLGTNVSPQTRLVIDSIRLIRNWIEPATFVSFRQPNC
jgi:hypothetical protein